MHVNIRFYVKEAEFVVRRLPSPEAKTAITNEASKSFQNMEVQSCSECETISCDKLTHLDKRYRERYGMSMIENLTLLKKKGIDEFLREQAEKYHCPNCDTGVICVHDNKCFSCSFERKD